MAADSYPTFTHVLLPLFCIVYFNLVLVNGGVLTREDLIDNTVTEGETYLSTEDFRRAQGLLEVDLSHAGVDTRQDPLLSANKFEGDIAGLSKSSIHQYINDSNSFGRNAIRDTWRRWPNGQIPYVISTRYGSYSKMVIAKAMDEYHKKTCIRFIPRDENLHRDYIYIFPDDGCYSLVGRTGGRQPVSLDSGCIQTGTVQHELMHATGFFHEQSRSDRESYIEIIWDNVLADATDQFEMYTLRTITLLDLPYDYGSIMHYGPYAFTKNGQRTIRSKQDGAERMGQRDGFSDLDLQKLNKLYECSNVVDTSHVVTTTIPTTTTTQFLARANCENKKWQCFFWQRLNYCESYADYMKENCPYSCNLCPAIGKDTQGTITNNLAKDTYDTACINLDARCEEWSMKGYCTTGRDAQRICPKSCGQCPSLVPSS